MFVVDASGEKEDRKEEYKMRIFVADFLKERLDRSEGGKSIRWNYLLHVLWKLLGNLISIYNERGRSKSSGVKVLEFVIDVNEVFIPTN